MSIRQQIDIRMHRLQNNAVIHIASILLLRHCCTLKRSPAAVWKVIQQIKTTRQVFA